MHTPVLIGTRNDDPNAKPFSDRFAFEMYNMGDLITAACVHNEVTGKENFLTIAKKRLGCNHRDVAIMLKCMAQVHHERSEFNQAAALYREALTVGEAAMGMNHPEVASCLNK